MKEPADRDSPRRSSQHHGERTDGAVSAGGTGRDTDFTQFYREATKPLVAFLILQGATVTEAVDIAQDTMTKAFHRWHTINYPHAWTRRVASRAFIRLRVDHPETPVDPPPQSPLLHGGDIEGWELHDDLVRALAQLPSRQRQVMAWTLAGHTPGEIADELNISPATVRQHLYLARQTLSTSLARKGTRP